MPTYVYACRECEARKEVVQKMSDPALTECESCGGTIRRVLFPPAVVYKGSGFYTTDYKNGGRSNGSSSGTESSTDSKPDSKSEAKTEGKSETKTESKSETKTEAKTG